MRVRLLVLSLICSAPLSSFNYFQDEARASEKIAPVDVEIKANAAIYASHLYRGCMFGVVREMTLVYGTKFNGLIDAVKDAKAMCELAKERYAHLAGNDKAEYFEGTLENEIITKKWGN